MTKPFVMLACAILLVADAPLRSLESAADTALRSAPVFDGHNDVPEQLRDRREDVLEGFDFRDTRHTVHAKMGHTAITSDVAQLKAGKGFAQL